MSLRETISFFYPDSKARLGEIVVDAFLKETHAFSSEITEHPVESGCTISDHIYNLPFSLSLDGIISNTPMTLVGLTAFDSAQRQDNSFSLIAFEQIEKLFKERKPITIATSLKTYHKMVLENLSIDRGEGRADSLHFTCTAKQIRFVNQKSITIHEPNEPAESRAQPKQKRGLQESKPVPKEQAEKLKTDNSLLFSLGKKLLGG